VRSVFNAVMRLYSSIAIAVVVGNAVPAMAQQGLRVPEPSPAASVSQTIGLTKVEVSYHRPAINKRKVFGALVPWNEVWRAGANENTTVSFSSPVKIEGHALPAGTYGLHMIPTPKQWTIIFSNISTAWGSYGYDAKEDALRVTVTPHAADLEERLDYEIEDPTDHSGTVTLHWEKLEVPFKVEVDTPAVVMASMRAELRGVAQFSGVAWTQAAGYWVTHGGDLDEAQHMADRALTFGETFGALRARAAVAEKKGDAKLAGQLRDKAMTLASENDLNQFGYTLLFQKKVDEAIGVFKQNVQAHPQSWNAYDSLGEAYMAKNDPKNAAENYGKALTLVKDEPNKKRIEQTLSRLKNK
jgi:tetratricopeptide (TPR) repeat protein